MMRITTVSSIRVKAEARGTNIPELDEQVDHMVKRFEEAAREFGATVEIFHDRHYYSYHVPEPLDIACMGRALEPLLGEHDFAAFGMPMERTRAGTTVRGTTVRTLVAAHCWAAQPLVYFYLEANAFLRHMVRLIVGTVLRVGQGRLAPSAVRDILGARRLAASGPAVPARGLYLVKVTY